MSKNEFTRREFLKKSAVAGAGIAIGSTLFGKKLFASSGKDDGKSSGEKPQKETGGGMPMFDGQKMNMIVVGGELDDTPMRDWKSKFDKETGMDLYVHDLGYVAFHDKLVQVLRTNTYAYDVTAITPIWLQEVVVPGYLVDLSPLAAKKEITLQDTIDGLNGDFFEAFIDYAGWYNPDTQMPGHEDNSILYLLPGTHAGGTMLCYRQDVFDKYGVKAPPTTWEDFNKMAKEFARPKEDFYGTSFTGKADSGLTLTDWMCRFTSQGGVHIKGSIGEKNVRANVYNDMGINALQWLKDLVPYAPPGVFSYGAAEASEPMQAGKVAMQAQLTTFSGRFWVPELSKIADVVKGTEVPGVGKYKGVAFGGGWSWGIPTTAPNKEAAWVAAQYFSSKEFDKYRCMQYGLMPVRKSTVNDPEVQKVQPWAEFAEPIVNKGIAPEYFYFPEAFEILDLFGRQLNLGLTGTESVDKAMKDLDDQMNAIFKRGGWQANL